LFGTRIVKGRHSSLNKVILFGRAGVGSAYEYITPLKTRYINDCNE